MSQDTDLEEDGYTCMELPTLIKQLKSVLDQYPDDGQILKELIQNAEDADASEMRILYDARDIKPPVDPNRQYLASLQAPALCVYNNALFTEKDWEGIKMLHNSIKEEDPLKVGRFGLGFKSVFHITDFPCILSGDTVLFINPHVKNLDRVCYKKKLCSLPRETTQTILQILSGTFGFTADVAERGYYKGTIFWFPLRVKTSDLSDNCYNEKKVTDLFQAFKTEASITLLFLKTMEKIQLYQRLSETVNIDFTLQLSPACLQLVRQQKLRFISEVKQLNGRIPPSSIESKLNLTVEMQDVARDKSAQDWIVINFYKGGDMSDQFRQLCSDSSLSYSPYVGLAVPVGKTCEGHVFCFLPLPLESHSPTGLQVHVNGFFALSQNRRHVKWPTADQLQNQSHTDKAIEWNKCLVSEVLPEVYCNLLRHVIKYSTENGNSDKMRQDVYRMIPAVVDVDVNWRPLLSLFHDQLYRSIPFLFTPINNGMWINLQQGFLVDEDSEIRSLIADIFTLYNRNFVPVPSALSRALQTHFSRETNFVTAKTICETLRSDDNYTSLPRQKKLALVQHLLESDQYELLNGLYLLPVADGNFAQFGTCDTVFCDNPVEVELFPCLNHQFASTCLPSDLHQLLKRRASDGVLGLSLMTPGMFPEVLRKCLLLHFPGGNAELPSQYLNLSWLKQVWNYITGHGLNVQSTFRELQILPDVDICGRGKLHCFDNVFIAQSISNMESLPSNVGSALQKLDIIYLKHVPDFVLQNPHVLGKVIQYPTQAGVMRAFEKVCEHTSLHTAVQRFNAWAQRQERKALVDYMGHCQISHKTMVVLKKLAIFPTTDNSDCAVESQLTLAPDENIPVPYPERYMQCSSHTVKSLAQKLGVSQEPLLNVCQQILSMMLQRKYLYTDNQITDFIEFLMESRSTILENTKEVVSEIDFLSSRGGCVGLRACDLFSHENDFLRKLFSKEDKFPHQRHTRTETLKKGLKIIGLKTEKEISESDIVTSAKKIEELVHTGMNSDAKLKASALIDCLERNLKRFSKGLLSDLKVRKCIPCMQRKPATYPPSLTWKGDSSGALLCSNDVYSSKYSSVIGSVSPVASAMPETVQHFWGLSRHPETYEVIQHLKNMGSVYTSREHNHFIELLNSIYIFLHSQSLSNTDQEMMASTRSVWVGIEEGFQYPKSVYIPGFTDLDLKPYRYPLPSLLGDWSSLFQDCGCHPSQTPHVLTGVLEEIKEKHDGFKTSSTKRPIDVQNDLKLILQILNEVKKFQPLPDTVYLPVHQKSDELLCLLPAGQCTYCNADWLKDQTSDETEDDDDEIFFVHPNISENTAQQLGVCSLTERVMDDTDDFDMEYHQSEPLPRRLKNLLREYTDGFSVPKELIQNADDAGATEVCFMHDERQNQDSRTSLMNENMAALQGPAFWAYNNSSFKESDFNNIKKLSGATKEEDTTKVGKFGLGFNSVYNLTDVPSFISENNMVIFDPQKKHLGKPGLRANLKSVKNRRMLRKMSGQFKPFEGIFGCQFRRQTPGEAICNGTLFRFPLRTQDQALVSEIKDLSYSAHEMGEFFKKFAESSGNLLLFTQNVSSVKFYHLPPNGDPKHPELLLHVKRAVQNQTVLSPFGSSLTGHSVLSYAAEEWKKQTGVGLKIRERTDIHLQTLDAGMTRKLKCVASVNIIPWLIMWVTGQRESESFARSGKLKGLLPLAAVALPLKVEDGRNGVYEMNECPAGFYRQGHYFCFLPLPVHIPFPVHINATFALTSDRRQLCTKTDDDKVLHEADWNHALNQDAVCRSYVSALVEMPVDLTSHISSFYQLWPHTFQTEEPMVRSFYKVVAQEDEQVFLFSHNDIVKRTSFHRIRFLDPKLHSDAVAGNIAFKAAVHFWNSSDEDVVDIPSRILESFKASDLSNILGSRCISTFDFFSTVFFPNVSDVYWTTEDRDKLTIFALNSEDSNIYDLIKSTMCIPSRPHGVLKLPRQLVHPHGQCAVMFLDGDGCFPTGTSLQGFAEPHLLVKLCELGMVRDDLPGESLLERAQSVASLHQIQPQDAVKRCWKIVDYISWTDYSSRELSKKQRITKYPDEAIQKLKEIPFLPIMQHPETWPLSWKADEIPNQVFAKASEMFVSKVLNLVGCSELVIDCSYRDSLKHEKDVLALLGLQHKDKIDVDVAARQLLNVAEKFNSTKCPSLLKKLSDMCFDIYTYLQRCCEETESADNIKHRDTTLETLRKECVILVGEQMVRPHQVAFQLSQDLSPHLYQVNTTHKIFRQLFEVLGVKKNFDVPDILHVVRSISDDTVQEKLSNENLTCIERLMNVLIDILPDCCDQSDIPDIMLPDRHGFLCKASSLCFDDCDWVDEDDSMKFLNPKIHPMAAKWFGVKGKREADLSDHISSIESFGQSEKLTSRIRRILSGYPCDNSIMKELLQNADDADATVLMFIKDFRSLPTMQVFGENWPSLQGPALCVYNDSFFTDKDFSGIKLLGEGSKGDDPLKTGQYGVGFNAVYHLTDVPSFMTVGPETGKTICALDPHVKYVPWATSKNPGVKIKDLDKLRVKYKDVFEGYLEGCVPLQEKGTIFRFPLRTEAMAEDSLISKKEITTDMIKNLLEEFKKDMFHSLLFLHNVKKIVIASISADGELSSEYSVQLKMTETDAQNQKKFMEDIKSQAEENKKDGQIWLPGLSPKEVKLSLQVEDSAGKEQQWLVVHQSGFISDKDIPVSVSSSWARGDIGLLPRGGIAVPIPPKSAHSRSTIEGKAFCILPLPVSTGLPVHVNGHFALDHEARRNLWNGAQDYRSDWNKHIVEAIVIPAYLSAMETMKTKMYCTQELKVKDLQQNLNDYYLFLPDISEATDIFWKSMSMSFYTNIVERQSDLFGVINPVDGKFCDYHKGRTGEIKASVMWVPVTKHVGFAGYFNNLESYYEIDRSHIFRQSHSPAASQEKYERELAAARRNTQQLSEILRDLNMKVIEAPYRIYVHFQEAEQSDKVSCVTPEQALHFLKSHADESHDKCTLGILPRRVDETPYKSVSTVKLLTGFIERADSFASEISGLPLAMTISTKVGVFCSSEPLIVTHFADLLTSIPDVALHPEIAKFYLKHATQSSSLKEMQIGTFASMLPDILVPEIFSCKSWIPWEQNPDFPSRHWIAQLWKYLKEEVSKSSENKQSEGWLRNQLEPISLWCLLPSTSENLRFFLYTIKDSSKLIDLNSITDRTCAEALRKMKINHFDQLMFYGEKLLEAAELCQKLVANWKNPDAVLFALSTVHFSECESVSEMEAESFLYYFCKNLDSLNQSQNFPNPMARLKSLPFFPTVTSKLVPVVVDVYAVKSSSMLPKEGLDHWSALTGRTLIKYNEMLNELFKYMSVPTLTLTQVYSDLLIPGFHHFPSSVKPVHLKFIKENLLKKSENYSVEQQQLIKQLKDLPFIETSDGKLHRAIEFYSRKEVVFATMCPDSAFPPHPYDIDNWHNFLVLIGLQAVVSVEHFVTFAEQVERLGLEGISKDVAKKSQILVKHLCRRPHKINEGILYRVLAIKFLLPYIVDKEHETGIVLTKLHPQFQAAKSLVCYSESLGPQHCYCVWTSCTMFRTEDDPSQFEHGDQKKIVLSQLGIPDTPPANTVVQHVLNICTSVTKMQKKLPIQSEDIVESLKKVMKAVYEYLQKHGISDIMKGRLTASCTVFLPEEKIFVAADTVVTCLSKDEVIDGYVYAGPLCFGEFFPVFQELGAAETASAKTFACALQKLKGHVGNKELNPNELHVAKTAMDLLFRYLRNNTRTSLDLCSLFLPNYDKIMTLSTKLVFSDNRLLRQRVTKLKLNFFVGFKDMEIKVVNPLQTISLLPPEHRPKILSEIMKENLTDACIGSACEGDISSKVLNVLQTPEFISGLVRLVNHEKTLGELGPLAKADCETLEQSLSNIELFEVEDLETMIMYNGSIVEGSECSQTCVPDKRENQVSLYISTEALITDEDSVYSNLAFEINALTGYLLGQSVATLVRMLKCEPQMIHELLDKCKILAFDYSSSQLYRTVFPPPGTIVPEKFHFMLDNSFSYFKEREYAGYEVYDPLIDDEVDDLPGDVAAGVGDVFLVYVIIRKVVTLGDAPFLARYIIEGKDGTTEEVCATQLYKFFRDKEDMQIEKSNASPDSPPEAPVALEVVLREIRNTLREAWAMLGERERNRVKKRLYIKWHPDKNPDRSDFCNEVCKYIGIYVVRLEKGLSIDDIHDETDGGTSTDYSWFHQFHARTTRDRSYQEQYQHSHQYHSEGGSYRYHQSTGDSHPAEARRWLRQAKADLDAGREALGLSRAYNWICFMGQQAAEKAIKSLLYNRDSRQADAIRTHDISSLSGYLGNPSLTSLASRLQSVIQDFNRLRYPDRLAYPRIPADVYTHADATQACALAGQIVSLVEQQLR
ncbi:sacsin-like [Haliotis cracherodii]|uniref:sacsin-like n=1 Tax=Haliotis cracherodii TaxID=6455 RepID=UPI0039E8DD4B